MNLRQPMGDGFMTEATAFYPSAESSSSAQASSSMPSMMKGSPHPHTAVIPVPVSWRDWCGEHVRLNDEMTHAATSFW